MKFFIFINIFISTAIFSQAKTELTLEDAQDIAIDNNYQISSSEFDIQKLIERKKYYESFFYPSIGIQAESPNLINSSQSQGQSYLYLKQNILNKNNDHRNIDIEKSNIIKQKKINEIKKFHITLDVEFEFHKSTYYQDLIYIQEYAIKQNRSHIKIAKSLMSKGRFSKADVMFFEAQNATLKSDLEGLKQDLEESRIEIKRLLGNKIGPYIRPVGRLTHQHIEEDLMFYINKGYQSNEQIILTSYEIEKSSYYLQRHYNDWLPDINLEVKSGYINASNSQRKLETQAVISFDFNFFSGFSGNHTKNIDRYTYEKNNLKLKQDILDLITNIEISYRRLKTIEKRIDLESKNIDMNLTYFNFIEKEYKRGYKTSSDLLDALSRYIQSQKKSKKLKFSFLSERIQLEKTLGSKVRVKNENH
ncbi:MAG: TolC family protein [Oligoflexales bacterium]